MTKKRKKKKKTTLKEDELKELALLKKEVARDLGLDDDVALRGWANLTSRETGKIGGHMAQRLKKKRGNLTNDQADDHEKEPEET